MKRLELLTLPLRALVLLILVSLAYYFGFDEPTQEWRTTFDRTGVVARYTRGGRPWRLFYDRNGDQRWDMWIDERGGPPLLVSVDNNADGQPDMDLDEFGVPVDSWRAAAIRAGKTAREFLQSPRQLQYTAIALMLYVLLEFAIRSVTQSQ